MRDPSPRPSPPTPAHLSPHLATLRECQGRMFDREGVPMYLTLVSETQPLPEAAGAGEVGQGEQVAARMDAARADLLPSARDGDLGALVAVLQAVSYADLFPGLPQ